MAKPIKCCSNVICFEEKRTQYQMKVLSKHFPQEYLKEVYQWTPERRKQMLDFCMKYIALTPQQKDEFHSLAKIRLRKKNRK